MRFRCWPLSLLFPFLFAPAAARAATDDVVLVRDGVGEMRIQAPTDAPPAARDGVDALRRYVKEISGAELSVDAGEGPYIVIEVGESADPELRVADLGRDGFRIKTVGRDLVFSAATGDGLRNAVYTFLETYLGCRKYGVEAEVVPRAATIAVPPIDDTQVPRLSFRMQDIRDPEYVAWHKLDTCEEFGLFVHTFDELVPPDRYFAEHPEYFSLLNGERMPTGQLCLSHPDVFEIVVDEVRRLMAERPEATFWSVSQNDTYCPCECDACRAVDEAEGTPAGSIIAFINRVADAFPDMTISTLAYQYSRAAPKQIRPRPNVNIMLCSIECDRSRPLVADERSASFVRDVRDWGRLTNNILLWDYVIQFRNLLAPFPNLRVLQPNLQFFVESGITQVFEQGMPVMYGEFAELRTYLLSKLLWDPYQDVDVVMDDFLEGFYGPAAPHIRRYIDTMHDALAESGEDLDIFGYPLAPETGFLSPARLDAYDALLAKAEAAVADDPILLTRVHTARLPVRFTRLEQAKVAGAGPGGCFLRDDEGHLTIRPGIEELLETFVRHCRDARIPRLWEHGIPPDEYHASTRRFLEESTRPHLALGRPVTLVRPPSPKYHAGDATALTNGLQGWNDYRFHWLGFEGEDMDATVDLGTVETVSSVGTRFLQDILSWVFMPQRMRVSVSENGHDFHEVGVIETTTAPQQNGALVETFNAEFAPRQARYIRVEATSLKTCPTWHKGSGGPAWIFVDEITVR